jgi:hypothetical protein
MSSRENPLSHRQHYLSGKKATTAGATDLEGSSSTSSGGGIRQQRRSLWQHETSVAEDAVDRVAGSSPGFGGGSGRDQSVGKLVQDPLARSGHVMVDPSFDYQVR